MFFFNINVFGFKKQTWKTPIFVQKGGCNKTFFFQPVFCKMWEVIGFLPIFLPNFGWCSKKHYKKGISAQFQKQKIYFEVLLSGPGRCYYLGQVDCNLKMANLAQIITPQISARHFFEKQMCWNPYVYSVFGQTVFCKKQTWPRQ